MTFNLLTWVDDVTDFTAAVMNRIEQGIKDAHNPPLVTALPGGAVEDGTMIRFQTAAMLANGDPPWTLRYNASAPGAYKWAVLDAQPLADSLDTASSSGSAAYVDIFAVPPRVVLPLAGEYEIEHGAGLVTSPTQSYGWMSYMIGATAAADADAVQTSGNAGLYVASGRLKRKTFAAAATLKTQFRVNATVNTVYVNMPWIKATPLRVG